MGVSHLLEHMVFKGTERRSSREIALSLESLGGSLDAYTSREHTSFQARVLDRHLPEAMDVLADLSLHPLLRESDLELEREVVLEEIATVEDTPDDLIFDLHSRGLWGDHGYGHAILGTGETVGRMTADDLRQVHLRAYRGGNMVVAVAGNLDHDQVVELVRRHFSSAPEGPRAAPVATPSPRASGLSSAVRDSAQTHLLVAGQGVAHGDPRRRAVTLISQALGGGMSSRLFQRIREELGLAYAVYTWHTFHRSAGTVGVYLGTRPGTAGRALEAVHEELRRVAREGLPADELRMAREQVKGHLTLSLESLTSRLHKLAGSALYGESVRSLSQLLAEYDAVTEEAVAAAAEELFTPESMLSLTLGPAPVTPS
jgi:predicted Zn-dependent peptidase